MPQTMKEYKAHRKALKAQIRETKALLQQLEEELEAERIEMGHSELSHLEKYMEKSEPNLNDFKVMSAVAMADFRQSVNDFIGWVKGSKR